MKVRNFIVIMYVCVYLFYYVWCLAGADAGRVDARASRGENNARLIALEGEVKREPNNDLAHSNLLSVCLAVLVERQSAEIKSSALEFLDREALRLIAEAKLWCLPRDWRTVLLGKMAPYLENQTTLSLLARHSLREAKRKDDVDTSSIADLQIIVANKLTNETMVSELAKHGESTVRAVAAANVLDEALLAEVVLANFEETGDLKVAFHCFSRVSKPELLVVLEQKLINEYIVSRPVRNDRRELALFLCELVRLRKGFAEECQERNASASLTVKLDAISERYGSGNIIINGAIVTIRCKVNQAIFYEKSFETVFPKQVSAGSSWISPDPRIDASSLLAEICKSMKRDGGRF